MGLLKEVQNEQARAKVGGFGKQGSGKTTTLAFLALGVSKTFHFGAPVAMMDTEAGSSYLKKIFELEDVKLLVHKSGAFADMIKVLREAEESGCCAFIMDSVTHTWKELIDSYCLKKAMTLRCATCGKFNNEHPHQYCANGFKPKDYEMQFPDWKPVKAEWGKWTEAFLNSQLHCFIAGRAGNEYEFQINEKTEKKELIKGDSKMKAEGEFGYEPSLLIELETERRNTAKGHGGSYFHNLHVLKDRDMTLNGRTFDFPTMNAYKKGDYMKVFKVLEPHFAALNISGVQNAIGSNNSTELFDGNGDSDAARRYRYRTIALEESLATMQLLWPGRKDDDKALRIRVLETVWGTRAWSAVEGMSLENVQAGLQLLRNFEAEVKKKAPADDAAAIALLELLKTRGTIEGTAPAPLPNNGVTRAVIPNDDIPMPPIQQGLNLPPVPKAEPKPQEDEELAEITFRKVGKDIFLSGHTFPVKSTIRKLGGDWQKNTKEWKVTEDALEELNVICGERNIAVVEHRRHAAA